MAIRDRRSTPREWTPPTTAERIEELHRLREQTLAGGGERRVTQQHERGKLTARERLDILLDPGTFQELDAFVTHRSTEFGLADERYFGDGVVTGYGKIDGRLVFVFSQDFTVFGGSLSEAHGEKICKVMDLAMKTGAPVIGLNDSGGARIQEGVVSLGGIRGHLPSATSWPPASIPQISAIMGPCAGGAVYSPAITDFIFMVRGTSHMFVTGPNVVKTVTHEDVTFEDLGGAMRTTAPAAWLTSPPITRSSACFRSAALLGFFPIQQHGRSAALPSRTIRSDRQDERLSTIIPDQPTRSYDMREVIQLGGRRRRFPRSAGGLRQEHCWSGFARLGGRTVGIVAQQPLALAGVLDIDFVGQGRALRPLLRLLQHSAGDLRGRARLPAGRRPGARRHHSPRRQAAVRLLRGHRAQDHASSPARPTAARTTS